MAHPHEDQAEAAERVRLAEERDGVARWKRWGPYLSERQWGTVREDYSATGDAWECLTHDRARSVAYRWGEDGIGGLSDDKQNLCISLALWNEKDPILKERLFGLSNGEGNHGEDVKELYYYLDATPTHSFMRMLYKYPHAAYPYAELVEENHRRDRLAPEFELMDTGLFDKDAYFDVFIDYAKADANDILLHITVCNRSAHAAPIHVLPQIFFRNVWSWKHNIPRPRLWLEKGVVHAEHERMEKFHLYADGSPEWLFTDNETNGAAAYGKPSQPGYFKDAFHEFVVGHDTDAVNPDRFGTKAAAHYRAAVAGGGKVEFRLRLTPTEIRDPFADFDAIFHARSREADGFYAHLQAEMGEEEKKVQRQAFAGMMWSKQFYYYDISQWLNGDPAQPAPPEKRKKSRNSDWQHLKNADIISMPDKWEYPWYAAWDLAFHCIPLAMIDAAFAKEQLMLLTRVWYMHPNGQLPAYEWEFSDVNPPVHAWACWRVFQIDRKQRGDEGDLYFLEQTFHKLMLNFTWWVNRKDPSGRNVFQGGFLGLDNIGIFDRSKPLPTGGHLEQADGTAWMAMYCLNLMRIALELATHRPVYEEMATKFFEHFLFIAKAMSQMGSEEGGLWDDQDKFYYDMLCKPDGEEIHLKIRSMVGLIPLFAVETLEPELLDRLPNFKRRLEWFLANRPELSSLVSHWNEPGRGQRRLLSLLRGHRMKRLLARMLDETEFLSPYGVRSLSKHHAAHPFVLNFKGTEFGVSYVPGESDSGLFGGNSNWRGPVWFPVNFLVIESLQRFHHYYGDDFKVECPTGSGKFLTIAEVASELSRRLSRLFLPDGDGLRPNLGKSMKQQTDPYFRDHLLFHEYFHGDDGRGIGASHQTGWTGLVAKLLAPRSD